jgi:hypothetical protein
MSWSRFLLLLLLTGNSWAAGEYVIGGGVEADTTDGIAGTLFGDLAVSDDTWVSGAVARTSVDLDLRNSLRTWYADIGIDHYFDPVGIRIGAAYWGDNSILDSVDARLSGYLRGKAGYLSIDYEYRDFEFDLPQIDLRPQRDGHFHANGFGFRGRVALSENVDLHASGISYDYSVDLRLDANRDFVSFLSVTRLSLINTLVDYRARIGLGFDVGAKHIEFDVAQWKGAVAGARTNSYSLRFLTPIGDRNDIEVGIGYDDSDTYGQVTIFSIHLFFYGT